jgi:hypothetical protein
MPSGTNLDGRVAHRKERHYPRISAALPKSGILVPGLLCLSACSAVGTGSAAQRGGEVSGGNGGAAAFSAAGNTGVAGVSAITDAGGSPGTAGAASVAAGASGTSLGGAADGSGASGANAASASAGSSSSASAGVNAGGASGAAGGSDVPANFLMRYEAESPLNTLTYPVEGVGTEGAPACTADGVKEGAVCASGGKVVNQILGRSPCTPPDSTTSYTQCQNKGGGVQFNTVTVPVDGTYDVTWWYHCGPDKPGHADVFGDTKCGGLNYDTGAGSGCRPHLIDVNGVPISSTVGGKTALYYQFPCYPAPWSTLHGATTALPLKAGSNTIYIHAPGATTLDAADIDALDVQPAGHGTAPTPLWPKLVTPVVVPN